MSAKLIQTEHLSGVVFDGQWHTVDDTVAAVEPATGDSLGKVGVIKPAAVGTYTAQAQAAQRDVWAAMDPVERSRIMRDAARHGETHFAEIVDWLVREGGSTPVKAKYELGKSITTIYMAADMPLQSAGRIVPTQDAQRMSLAYRRPVGVVGVISPFNVPFYLAIRAVAPALAVGNAVVLKPDSRTAISGGYAIARIFELAGLPAGVLSVVPGDGAVGAALCEDPHVNMIQFTGSSRAGRKVGETAGRTLKRVSLELGGKNALIVLDDADLDLAVKSAARSAYMHQGQVCMAAGRILVQEKMAPQFIEKLLAFSQTLKVGNPALDKDVQLGPMIDQAQVTRAKDMLDEACAKGARCLTGGTPDGLFFPPTVVDNISADSRMYHEEVFAPVAAVLTFKDDDDAVRLANDTDYGLTCSIFTASMGRALAMQKRLHAGTMHVNDSTIDNEVLNPYGGVGSSGNGSAIGGPANWEEFTFWQWVTIRSEAKNVPL